MSYGLAAGLSYCEFGDRIVLLDAPRDRYRQLSARRADGLRKLARGERPDSDLLRDLEQGGIISAGSQHGKPIGVATAQAVTRSAIEECSWSNPGSLQEVGRDLVRAWLAVKLRPFHNVLEAVRERRRSATKRPFTEADLIGAAAAFERRRRMIPIEPICLPDSLALLSYLFRRGMDADLVLAVKLDPFGAHCWVQARDIALNEAVDRAAMHAPIRVV